MKKRIFFDQDGTLVESGPGIKHSARKTLEKRKLPVIPYEELDFFVGPPLRDCFRLCHVPEERIEEACLIFIMRKEESMMLTFIRASWSFFPN